MIRKLIVVLVVIATLFVFTSVALAQEDGLTVVCVGSWNEKICRAFDERAGVVCYWLPSAEGTMVLRCFNVPQ